MPVKLLVNKMMQHPITDRGFMNIAWLWIGDVERRVWTVNIGFAFEVRIKVGDVGRKLGLKFYDILFVFFAAQKSLPRQE